MIQNNYFTDNDDLQLYFNHLVDWDEIVKAYEGEDFGDAKKYAETGNERYAMAPSNVAEALDFYTATLEAVGQLAGTEVAPRAQQMDWTGLKFADGKVTFPQEMIDIYELFKNAGLTPYNIKRDYNGLGLPATANAIYTEILCRADTAFTMALGLQNLAKTIVRYGTEEQKETYVTKMAAGEYLGAMALTEPNYGSDLRNVKTRAVKQADGSYRITGAKRFISQGCGLGEYPSIILTLARTTEGGARGLSLFIVKSTDVEIGGVEKKMGIHASPTCEVIYDNTPAEIVGEEGYGLTRYTLSMMNDARCAVAALGPGIGSGAYYESRKYASEREQFGKTIDQIPAVRRMLDRMERENMAMRLLTGEGARAVDMYLHHSMRIEKKFGLAASEREIKKDEHIRMWDRLASLFTPLSKFYCSEMGITLASDAVQIHGGAGYTEEYDVARIYRDSRINTVYEGTTQLQVVAAIGGLVAGMAPKGNFRVYFEGELSRFTPSKTLLEQYDLFQEAIEVYKSVEDGEVRDTIAFEVVEIAARLMCGMLYERAASRVDGANRERLLGLLGEFHIDSTAIMHADLYKLKARGAGAGKLAAV